MPLQALRLVSNRKPDACVIDIGLPGMNGYELARRLREIPATRESRLIAVTGYGTKSDKETFEEAGFDHFFHQTHRYRGAQPRSVAK